MSKLSAFLHPAVSAEPQEVVVSKRFQEDGAPKPFRIRPLTQEENERLVKLSTRTVKVDGQPVEQLDNAEYTRRLVVASTVEPDFSSTEMCEAYGVLDPLLVPGRMLLSGEFSTLVRAITKLSGFVDLELEEQVKN